MPGRGSRPVHHGVDGVVLVVLPVPVPLPVSPRAPRTRKDPLPARYRTQRAWRG